jgi:hypothetical protein
MRCFVLKPLIIIFDHKYLKYNYFIPYLYDH